MAKSLLIVYCLVSLLTTTTSIAADAQAQANSKRGLFVKVKVQNGTEIELYGESHALVVGVSEYGKGLRDLPGVKRDVVEVKVVLESHGFEVRIVTNPTRKKFDDEINAFIDDFGQSPSNRLLIYFAGHGATMTLPDGRGMGYILPADVPPLTDGTGAFRRTAISMDAIDGYARRIESKHALFVFDSCFSGSLFEALRPGPVLPAISAKVALPVRQFITAGTAEQLVPDQSMFCAQFVAGLDGEADLNSDGYVTVTELAMFIEDKVTNYSKRAQTPRYGKIRDPKLDQGDMVFVLPKTHHTPSVAVSVPPPLSTPTGTQPTKQPAIEITTVPTYSPVGGPVEQEDIAGVVSGVEDPMKYRVVIYAQTNHWWVQPLADAPLTEIGKDARWRTRSHLGSRYAALLVKPSFNAPSESQALPTVGGEVVAITIVTGKRK